MRLAFIASSYPPHISGVSVNAVTVTNGMAKKGHHVRLFIPEIDGQFYPSEISNLSVQFLPSIANPFFPSHRIFSPVQPSLIEKFKLFKPDIVHFQEPNIFLYSQIKSYLKEMNIPVVFAHHFPPEFITNSLPSYLNRKALNSLIVKASIRIYRHANLVITPTHTIRRLLLDKGLSAPIKVISNGVDSNKYLEGQLASSKKANKVVLYLGRVDFDKNLEVLVHAVEHVSSNCEFWIAGKGMALDHLKKLASNVGQSHRIKFLGYIPEEQKSALMHQATIFVIPSTAEAQSIVSLEASACHLPLIVANAAALPELILSSHRNGLLFEPNNYLDLAAKIDELLSEPKLLQEMVENSKYLVKIHDITSVLDDYENAYLSCLE